MSNSFDMFLPCFVVQVFDSPFFALVSGLDGRFETTAEGYLGRDLVPTFGKLHPGTRLAGLEALVLMIVCATVRRPTIEKALSSLQHGVSTAFLCFLN